MFDDIPTSVKMMIPAAMFVNNAQVTVTTPDMMARLVFSECVEGLPEPAFRGSVMMTMTTLEQLRDMVISVIDQATDLKRSGAMRPDGASLQ